MKKAQIDLQFNWIYILIIGGLIFIGSISAVSRVRKTSADSYITDVNTYVSLILNTIRLNVQSQSLVELGGAEIEFTCDHYSIKESDLGEITLNEIIFSPNLVSGNLLGYSLYFELPFKAELLGFITSSRVKYVLKNSPEKMLEIIYLNTSLPANINKQIVNNYNEINNENYDKIRYITFENVPSVSSLGNLDRIDDEDVSLVKISIDNDFPSWLKKLKEDYRIYDFGKVEFYQKKGNSFEKIGEVFFVDKASLIAAIYSENPERYFCGMEKSLTKLNINSEIKKRRIEKLVELEQCPYLETIEKITNLITLTDNILYDNNYNKNLYITAARLVEENKLLAKLSCPTIY